MKSIISAVDVLEQACGWIGQGRRVALATVISTWGSSPCPVGSQLAINDLGAFVGSVSGGCVEGAVVDCAKGIFAGNDPIILPFTVSDDLALGVGLTCGGSLQVFVMAIPDAALLSQLCDHVSNRVPACLLTHMESGQYSLLTSDDARGTLTVTGQIQKTIRLMLDAGESAVLPPEDNEVGELFAHSFIPSPRLFIIGAGHIAQALAPMADIAGFDVCVIDPRTAFATPERFPSTDLSILWPDDFFEQTPLDANTAVVTLVHDAKIDDPALMHALASDAFYVGALGSRKTHEKRKKRFLDNGFSEQGLARIHAPIGLNIGGRKPSDIAVSIIAEIVETWNSVELKS
ncbi:MAG: XdhC family protein [Rhodospirillales bacterium]|nr:XdhC family protein [Rhodospirillales bacterium]